MPSAVALGVLVDVDQSVKQAGGYIVQLMPGATDADITRLENNIANAGAVTTMLEKGMSLEDIAHAVLMALISRYWSAKRFAIVAVVPMQR